MTFTPVEQFLPRGRRRGDVYGQNNTDWIAHDSESTHTVRRQKSLRNNTSHAHSTTAQLMRPNTAPPWCNGQITPQLIERTPSGRSIVADIFLHQLHDDTQWLDDETAARCVQNHVRETQFSPDDQPERILRSLISRPEPLDDTALGGLILAVNYVFFHQALTARVDWEWSAPSQKRYEAELVGSTSLRLAPRPKGGVETLIVLSTPLLRSANTDRRMVICAVIHELIHCYLFIMCGFKARIKGGHTNGFETIAAIIDDWVGRGQLPICNMKADLHHFNKDQSEYHRHSRDDRSKSHGHPGCNQSPSPSIYTEAGDHMLKFYY